MEYNAKEFNEMNAQLNRMGIRFENIGKPQATSLPPLPSTDSVSMARNTYSGFYKTGARDFWQHSQLERNELKDFKKCEKHYFVYRGTDKVMCKICNMGYVVGSDYRVSQGKLYNGQTELQF